MREAEREPEHAACSDFPAVCIAAASEIGNRRAIQGKPYPLALTHDGDDGDDYEPLRRDLARNIPSREFGGKYRILSAA